MPARPPFLELNGGRNLIGAIQRRLTRIIATVNAVAKHHIFRNRCPHLSSKEYCAIPLPKRKLQLVCRRLAAETLNVFDRVVSTASHAARKRQMNQPFYRVVQKFSVIAIVYAFVSLGPAAAQEPPIEQEPLSEQGDDYLDDYLEGSNSRWNPLQRYACLISGLDV